MVDENYKLKGLITVKDIQKKLKYPNAAKDDQGRLRVGAAIGAGGDFLERAQELVAKKVDVLVIDTAHGHSERVLEAVAAIKKALPEVDLMAGQRGHVRRRAGSDRPGRGRRQSRRRAGLDLHDAGGLGRRACRRSPRSAEAARAARGTGVPIISDGGVKYSGDITKAIAAGAACVMIGSLFAGTDESPGETILYQGRTFKSYRGMGSMGAMAQGSSDRYAQDPNAKLVPEGHRRPRALQRADLRNGLPVGGRAEIGHGLLRLPHDRRSFRRRRSSCGSRRPACARATSTT